ncbi:hypothetical protein ACOMHN_044509 [Nucella lapillus]
MNLPAPVCKSSYSIINKTLEKATSTVQGECMARAASIEHRLTEETEDDVRDIDVSVDGTYMTRGHSSKIGVVTAIGLENGNVLDSGTKSKVCKSCDYWEKQDQTSDRFEQWQGNHDAVCTMTHEAGHQQLLESGSTDPHFLLLLQFWPMDDNDDLITNIQVHNVLEQYCGAQATGSLWMSYTLPTDLALPPPQDTLPPFSKDLQVLCLCTGRPPFLLTIYDLNLVYKEDLNLDAKEDTASVTFQSYFKF